MVGFHARNNHELDIKFICPTCSLLLRDPIQLMDCGHRLCQSCFDHIRHGTTIKCAQCLTETPQYQVIVDRGFQHDMQSLPINCSFCQWTDVLNNYQDHLDHFHSNSKCDHCDEQFDSVNKLNEHKVLQCQKNTVVCWLKDFGCSEKIIRCSMWNHYWSEQHENALLKALHQMKSHIDANLSQATMVVPVNPATALFHELYETINSLSGGAGIRDNDGQRFNNELLQCQMKYPTVTIDFLQIKPGVQESNSDIEGLTINRDILHQDLVSLKEKINNRQYVSCDGTYVWKITNFREKMTDAHSGRQISIYSPPFYSSPNGYKMCARLYLNGNGNARHTHMSLFFVLMRGLNDTLLRLPFNYIVTFCLYDQASAQRHIIHSFRPDVRSDSFQRPQSDMNVASGIPKFISISEITQEGNPYIRDNTIFIKAMVNFGNLPKSLLPYALSLNPGLPTHIQQAMIKQEAERRAQQQSQNE